MTTRNVSRQDSSLVTESDEVLAYIRPWLIFHYPTLGIGLAAWRYRDESLYIFGRALKGTIYENIFGSSHFPQECFVFELQPEV